MYANYISASKVKSARLKYLTIKYFVLSGLDCELKASIQHSYRLVTAQNLKDRSENITVGVIHTLVFGMKRSLFRF